MNQLDVENRMLRGKVESLEETVRQLREQLAPASSRIRREWRLSGTEARLFSHLTTREIATRQSILTALYSDRADDYPRPQIADVFISKLRKKLGSFGIIIDTVWGEGYSLRDRHQFNARGDA